MHSDVPSFRAYLQWQGVPNNVAGECKQKDVNWDWEKNEKQMILITIIMLSINFSARASLLRGVWNIEDPLIMRSAAQTSPRNVPFS